MSAGQVCKAHVGQELVLKGWDRRRRDLCSLVFVDLRDREGMVQLVFSQDRDEATFTAAKELRPEFVIAVRGMVHPRSPKDVNPHVPTGEVEVAAAEFKVLSVAKTPPFVVADPSQASEELRFKYRYLDLRRPSMQRNLRLRHEAALAVRNYMSHNGLLEVETPFLTSSTPEGARDFLRSEPRLQGQEGPTRGLECVPCEM